MTTNTNDKGSSAAHEAEGIEIIALNEVSDAVIAPDGTEAVDLHDAHIQIHEEGRKYKTTLTKKFKERKIWTEPDPNQILTHIPGEVSSILVKLNDKVKKGDKLLIYEAMKMKNIINAPFDGVIKAISVKEHDKLPKGALLMTLDPVEKK